MKSDRKKTVKKCIINFVLFVQDNVVGDIGAVGWFSIFGIFGGKA